MDELWKLTTQGGPTARWFARRQSGGIAGGILHSPQGLRRLVHNLSPSWDLYFNINPSIGRGVRVSSEDVTHWSTVLLDIDPTSADAVPMDAAMEYLSRARQIVGMVPATIVDSGRGVQVHLHLEPRPLDGSDERWTVRRAVGQFLRMVRNEAAPLFGCQLDLSCSDLARVARMPQTVNHKTGRRTTALTDPSGGRGHHSGLEDTSHVSASDRILALALVDSHDRDFASRPTVGVLRYQQVWSRLTATAQRFLDGGIAMGERHRTCVAAVKSLQENGVPSGEAQRVLVEASERCEPPLEPAEVLRIIRAAYAA